MKNQFVMDRAQADKPKAMRDGNQAFMTSNGFFHGITKDSINQQSHTQEPNPVVDQLDPAVFEVSAKKQSTIWTTGTYKQSDFRQGLNQTTNRVQHAYDQEVAPKMQMTNHNIKITTISEYSNALHRGRVFINPKFSSC